MLFGIAVFLIIGSTLLYKRKQIYFARSIMTQFEQKMFFQLKSAFPNYHVLSQVAFSALITNQNIKIRSRFNRKVTDFVLINDFCDVIAIIELDDPSHLHKQQDDKLRDHMLLQAGYIVLRYTEIPELKRLHRDIPLHKYP